MHIVERIRSCLENDQKQGAIVLNLVCQLPVPSIEVRLQVRLRQR